MTVQHFADPERNGRHYKRLPLSPWCFHQSLPQKTVYGAFKRIACSAHLILDEARNIVVNGESRSHIMMLISKAS